QPRRSITGVGPVSARVGAVLARTGPDADAGGDDKVELSSVQFQPPQLVPGDQVKMTLYFRVLDTIPDDWVVFVHVEDVDGKLDRINVDHRPMGGNYPTTQWKKGEMVRDEFGFTVPQGLPIRGVNIYVGLWDPQADRRMKIRNPTQVRNDGSDRLFLGVLPVAQ
ncbi:MAG TPA: hypothetical protein VFU23_01585, partial [Gemmatimonadales bacterium]|nr:hypothetical protein [Gemmatimonadales bacterium]